MEDAGRRLLGLARQAHIDRRFELLEDISNFTCKLLPDTRFARTAQYHRAYCSYQKRKDDQSRAELEISIEFTPPSYKPGALLALACTYLHANHIPDFAAISRDAIRASRGISILSEVHGLRNIAISRSLEGDHLRALAIFESLSPITDSIAVQYPADRLSHLNSLAIELGEVGRVNEANRIIDYVLSTPLAKNQPEWQHTKLELATKTNQVFPAFTMALGVPAEHLPQNRLEAESKAPDPQEEAQTNSQAKVATECRPYRHNGGQVVRILSRESRRALVVCSARPNGSTATQVAIQQRRNTPGLALQLISVDRGYAVSPPARAPPARL
ncbi:MAG: hypothetical protein ACREAC_27795, partial [Blastocatellia bacterium]